MSINNIANTVFPNTLSGLESLNVTNITINGFDVTALFVPYTGANTNVDLNNKNLASVNNVGTTTLTATGLVQGGNLTTTGLTTTNTLKINSVPAGTQVNLLAYDVNGNVIQGTVTTPVPSQFNITTTTGLGQYYIPLIATLSGATPIYGDQTGTIYYNNNLQKLTVGKIQLLALGAGTQVGILAYDSAYNVIQGSIPVPTQLYTTAITSGTTYFLPMVNSGSTGNTSYFSTGSFSYNYPTDTFLVSGTLQIGSNLILQGGTATTFSSLPSLLTPTFALGVNSNNQLVRFNLTNQIGLTAVSTNNDYNLIFTSSNTATSNAALSIDDGLNITYNPSTDLLSVSNISVTGTIGGPNTMTLLQGGTQLMTLSTMNIFAQTPLISGYGGAGQPPQFAFNQNGGTGSRFLLKGSGTALYPVGFGIDTSDEMWISNRNAGFNFYSNGTNTVQISTTGQLTLTNSMILGTLGTNQSIRLGWGNLPAMQATAFFNVAIGRNNGTNLTTGYNNVLIGESVLTNVTTGSNNVAIGYGAGGFYTTGANSVFIGAGANGLSTAPTAINQIVIATNGNGMGSNTVTVGNDDTTGFFVAGEVGNFFKARKTEVGAQLGSMADFSTAITWNDSNALFVTTGGLGGTNYGVGFGFSSTLGLGLLVSLAPNVGWSPIRYKASSHQFYSVNASVVTIDASTVSSLIPYVANTGYPVCYFMPSTVGNNSSFIIADSFATYTSPATTFCRIFGTSGILFHDSNAGFQWRSVPLATPYASSTQLMVLNSTGLSVGTVRTDNVIASATLSLYSGGSASSVNVIGQGTNGLNIYSQGGTSLVAQIYSGPSTPSTLVLYGIPSVYFTGAGVNWYIAGAQAGYWDNAFSGWRINAISQLSIGGGGTFNNIVNPNQLTTPAPSDWLGGNVMTTTYTNSTRAAGLGIGWNGTGNSFIISLQPSVAWKDMWVSAATTLVYFYGTFCAYTSGGGWVNVSDEREKTNIKPLKTNRSLERVLAATTFTYNRVFYNDDGGNDLVPEEEKNKSYIGIVAQQVKASNPHCLSKWKNKSMKDEERFGINYHDYTIHLIGAVQEQQKQITKQQEQIQQQQSQIDLLLKHVGLLTEQVNELTKTMKK